jgi:hypothetical protein
VKRERK